MQHPFRPVLLLVGFLLVGCGSEPEHSETMPGGAAPIPTAATTCTEGEVRECRIIVAKREGYNDCVVGSQVCASNVWSPCVTKTTSSSGEAGVDGGSPDIVTSDAGTD